MKNQVQRERIKDTFNFLRRQGQGWFRIHKDSDGREGLDIRGSAAYVAEIKAHFTKGIREMFPKTPGLPRLQRRAKKHTVPRDANALRYQRRVLRGRCPDCGTPCAPWFRCHKHQWHGTVRGILSQFVRDGYANRVRRGHYRKTPKWYAEHPDDASLKDIA